MSEIENKLLESKKPLFFRVENAIDIGAAIPKKVLGEDLRTLVRSLTVFQKEAIVTSNRTGKTWRLASDEGAYLNGTDYAPAPLCHLTVGMVASYMNEILALAKLRNIQLDDIRLIQDNFYSMKGSMMNNSMLAEAYDVHLEAQIESKTNKESLRCLVVDAIAASPLNDLLKNSHESRFKLSHNGQEVSPNAALEIKGELAVDPKLIFESTLPADGEWQEMCKKGGLTPKNENSVSGAGSSLNDQQNRLLHLRGICRLRPDGIKEITQHLYNPHGSVFTLLSEEGPENGGQGRAPDAATYISAGIGFCFMTQFGRYAKMKKKALHDYRIRQDSFFSLGGASGGTGQSGRTKSLETHVYLESEETDDFATQILDMSEQTCFLHALCKAERKTKIKITALNE